MVARITRDELREKIERGDTFTLVEVLPADVYAEGHLPGALNLATEGDEGVMAAAERLLPDRGADIVLYCGSLM